MEVERGERVYGKVLMKVAGQDFRLKQSREDTFRIVRDFNRVTEYCNLSAGKILVVSMRNGITGNWIYISKRI